MRFRDYVTIDKLDVVGDLLVMGSFSVIGSASTINTTNLTVSVPIILLAASQSGSPNLDSGFFINRGTGATFAMIWDESADEFAFIQTTDSSNVIGNVNITDYSFFRSGTISAPMIKNGPNSYLDLGTSAGQVFLTADNLAFNSLIINSGNTQVSSLSGGVSSNITSSGYTIEVSSNGVVAPYSYNFSDNLFRVYNDSGINRFVINHVGYGSNNHSLSIGTSSGSTSLHIFRTTPGAFRLQDTSEGSGRILVSDANGVGTWTQSSNIFNGPTGSGTASYMTVWSTSTQIASSNIWHSPGGTAIGIGTSSNSSQLGIQVNSNYADGISIKNTSTGTSALIATQYLSADNAGYLLIGILGDNNTDSSGIGSSRDSFIRQSGVTGSGGLVIGKQGGFSAVNTASYSIRFTHGSNTGLTFSSMLNMTKATFSSTYYHFGFGPGAANYGQTGYINFGTGSNQARFRHGELSISSAKSSGGSYGSAISSIMTAVAQTISNVTSDMYLDGDGVTGVEKIWVPDNSSIGYRIHIIGTDTSSGGASRSIHTEHVGTIRRPYGSNVVLDSDTDTVIHNGYGGGTTSIQADTTNNTLNIRVTGVSGYTIRWVAKIDIVQVIING